MTPRPWLKHYPRDTPADVVLDPSETLVSMFMRSCERFADRPAFSSFGTTLTYAELEQRSRAFAAFLQSRGLRKGDRIALMMPNILQYPVALFGALRAGLAVVNTNPLYTPRELEHQLRDSGASCIVVLENFAHVVEEVLNTVELKFVITTQLGDLLGFPRRVITNWAVRRVKKLVPAFSIRGAVAFPQALNEGTHITFRETQVDPTDVAFVQYTGGTTGVAKGAMLTHRNVAANLEQVVTLWRSFIREGEEIMITPLPLYHIFCLTCNCLTFTKLGGLNVLIANPRDISGFIAELKHRQFTFMTGVNTLYSALMDHHRFAQLDFSRLKLGVAGGMALQPSVAKRWQQITHRPLIEGYGLTEASPIVACNLPEMPQLGTVGVPLPSTEISIRDGDREVACGEAGELCVRGPQVMAGYWRHPEETAKTLDADGWLRTGDIATLDEEGFLRIVDRKKDMIIVSGFKVFPNEVEAVIAMHEAVLEVGCVGVPDERSGQAIKAFVVARSTTLSTDQLWAHCRQYLTAYKVPKYIEFRQTLPKTNVGKILRRVLADEARVVTHDDSSAVAH
jgi:long-chain acyl-CoA synthetase